jgi:excisionase family DNA binding protein
MSKAPKDPLPANKLAFTYRDAAKRTGLTRYYVAKLVEDGTLKTAPVAGRPRITRASLAAFIHNFADVPAEAA